MKRKYKLWEKSQCRGSWFHRYSILEATEDSVTEVCGICGTKVHHKIFNGKSNNTEYIRHHARQAIFPQHPLYYHEYEYENTVLSNFN